MLEALFDLVFGPQSLPGRVARFLIASTNAALDGLAESVGLFWGLWIYCALCVQAAFHWSIWWHWLAWPLASAIPALAMTTAFTVMFHTITALEGRPKGAPPLRGVKKWLNVVLIGAIGLLTINAGVVLAVETLFLAAAVVVVLRAEPMEFAWQLVMEANWQFWEVAGGKWMPLLVIGMFAVGAPIVFLVASISKIPRARVQPHLHSIGLLAVVVVGLLLAGYHPGPPVERPSEYEQQRAYLCGNAVFARAFQHWRYPWDPLEPSDRCNL